MTHPRRHLAFTLIELLIVVAIIAILAAIAVPNFLEAQTRSKVSRTLADMRSVATALESYSVDYNRYPPFARTPASFTLPGGPVTGLPADGSGCLPSEYAGGLTSPIAYITSIPNDPFGNTLPDDQFTFGGTATITDSYYYNLREWFDCRGFVWGVSRTNDDNTDAWVLQSKGPDKYFAPPIGGVGVEHVDFPYRWEYDPTNGTISGGNVIRSGP